MIDNLGQHKTMTQDNTSIELKAFLLHETFWQKRFLRQDLT